MPRRSHLVEKYPGGIKACSRWLSKATPPVNPRTRLSDPGRGRSPAALLAATPLGSNIAVFGSGGIASLNHRLHAGIPLGSDRLSSEIRSIFTGRQVHFPPRSARLSSGLSPIFPLGSARYSSAISPVFLRNQIGFPLGSDRFFLWDQPDFLWR